MNTELVSRKILTCSGAEDHGHELNFIVVDNPENLSSFEPNRFIKDRWNCYLFLVGEIDIKYKDIGIDRQITEKNNIIAYIDADNSGQLSYQVVDDNNLTVRVHSDWYQKNQMIEYSHPIWLSNMFENRVFQVAGTDAIAQRIFVSQKKMRYIDDNVSEVAEGYSSHYKFSYCHLEQGNTITLEGSPSKSLWFIGDTYTVNGSYMDNIDTIDLVDTGPVTIAALVDNCQIVMVEKV